MSQLCALCGVDAEDIADMISEIRQLNPKPGLAFGSEPVTPVVPDVFVREGADGSWQIELNSETLPRLLVNNQYYGTVSKGARDKDSKAYLAECLNNANWLVKSLDQRARTILKVSSEIVRHQDAFLTHGVRHLRPLNLRIIAEAISMHESTVSRVTSNKYIATPRGLFELKYVFTASIQSVNGTESHSAEAVRDRIREMIENEEPREILSDDRIVSLLTADGVNIARRTVAKYREALRIPSSVERRRLKAGEALAR
jgi:RNA polymerase sigma-54 factor